MKRSRTRPPPLSAQSLRFIERRGISRNGLRDVYHSLMTMPLPALVGVLAGVFIAVNIVFAAAYFMSGGLGGIGHGDFADAFFFSVQTLSTTGYGAIYPVSLAANAISGFEIMFGMLGTALATGVLFARLSRPNARVTFSRVTVVYAFKGTPTLMFRMINERRNQIAEARISVTVTREEDDGHGGIIRRMSSLRLEREASPIFALSWLVLHRITQDSPFYGMDVAALEAAGSVIICSLTGIDDTLKTAIYARHIYGPQDLRFNERFVDVIERGEGGTLAIDYRRFHDTVAV
jgi:inward rectifier potassium channel